MKTIPFLLLTVFSVTTAFSQKSGIKVDLIAPVLKTLVIAYEKVASDDASFQAGFSYTSDGSLRRLAFTTEYRFYVSASPAPAGFFVAPFAQYISMKENNSFNVQENAGAFGIGVVAGHQWLFKERVTFGLFFGPDYLIPTQESTQNSPVTDSIGKGFTLRGGVTLGIVF